MADIIQVPDLSAAELVRLAEQKSGLWDINGIYRDWDFFQSRSGKAPEKGGKRYEVLTWEPEQDVMTTEVRDHFAWLNAAGNTAAFIAWLMALKPLKPVSFYASLPEDDRLWRARDLRLCVPAAAFIDDVHKWLAMYPVIDVWRRKPGWTFVAFREVP